MPKSLESDLHNPDLKFPKLPESFHSGGYLRGIVWEFTVREVEVIIHLANLGRFKSSC